MHAGFPQKDRFPGYKLGTNPEIDHDLKTHVDIPTLEELIEA
jgi:hypothetical protein